MCCRALRLPALIHPCTNIHLFRHACLCRASRAPAVLHCCTNHHVPVWHAPAGLRLCLWFCTSALTYTSQSRSPLLCCSPSCGQSASRSVAPGNSAKQAAAAGEAKMALEPDVDVAAVFLARQSEACQQCLPFCVLWAAAYPSAC